MIVGASRSELNRQPASTDFRIPSISHSDIKSESEHNFDQNLPYLPTPDWLAEIPCLCMYALAGRQGIRPRKHAHRNPGARNLNL